MKYVLAGSSGFLGRLSPATWWPTATRSSGWSAAPTGPNEVRWDPASGDWIRPPSAAPTSWSTWPARTSVAPGPRRTESSAKAASALRHAGRRGRSAGAAAGVHHPERDRRLRPGLRRPDPHRGLRTRRRLPLRRRPPLGRRRRPGPRSGLPRRFLANRCRPRPGRPLSSCFLPFRLGVGGRLGSGKQYFPVVSLTDWLRAVRFVADHDELSGPVNVALPNPVTNQEFSKALATALHRPALIPVPSFVLTTPRRVRVGTHRQQPSPPHQAPPKASPSPTPPPEALTAALTS